MLDPIAFLNVAASATGRRWQGPTPDEDRLGQAIGQTAGVPEIVGRILARRGVTPNDARAYLAPSLRDLMPDPSSLRDMDRAAARLHAAVRRGERIAVFADYDVDGGASAALIQLWLGALGRRATLYVPDRIDEGYGPNAPAMAALGAAHDLIVCVDCGTLSHGPVAAAGCDVIVLDHHLATETLPAAVAVVNPNRLDESGALGHLCAAGVVFLTLVAVNRLMRAEGASGPDLMALLDLVALATVADVAPLVGLNRAFVRQGLAVMAGGLRPGLAALAEVAGLTSAPTVHSLGLRARPADQRRRPDRRGGPRGPAAGDPRPARGGGAGRAPAPAQRRAARDRGGGARPRAGAGRGQRRGWAAGLGGGRGLASRRGRHRRRPP